MPEKSATAKLEQSIEKYFAAYSARCVAYAAALTGVVSTLAGLVAYMVTLSELVALVTFLILGLIFVNVAILMIVPPTRRLVDARALLIDAVNQPSLIKLVNKNSVRIAPKNGSARDLRPFELKAWETIVMPFFMQAIASQEKIFRQELEVERQGDTLAKLDSERQELVTQTERFECEKRQLLAERAEVERRSQELMDAEELVIARLTQVEEAETQMAQIRDDLNSDTMRANASNDPAETKRKADELAKREADVEALKFTLMEDRKIVEQQKRELNQMKGTILQEFEASLGGQVTGASDPESESLQASLERRAAELEMAGKELEERSRYVDSVEDSLVERLGQLTEREAFLEQGEINQGIRSD
jgi:hypothetical protein